MDPSKPTTEVNGANGAARNGRSERRRKSGAMPATARFFLPKSGSSAERPELGREIATENEVLVEAFRSGQPFYTLVAWKAVPDLEDGAPKIVKEALKKT